MNRGLREVLAECDPAGETISPHWHDCLVIRNLGGVAQSDLEDLSHGGHRGFNLILLDRRGRPTRYCKCRHKSFEKLRQETALLETLSADSALAHILPRTRGGSWGSLQVQASTYVPGVRLDALLPAMNVPQWEASVERILTASKLVSDHALALIPNVPGGPSAVSLGDAGSDALQRFRSWDFPRAAVDALGAILEQTPPLPRSPQHCDLWAANVIGDGKSWWILDFDRFGDVQVPLYDACHLVRTSMVLLEPHAEPVAWIDRLTATTPAADSCRAIIRTTADRYGLSAGQAVGAAVFYIVHIAATFRASGRKSFLWKPLMLETERLAEHVQAGKSLEDMFLGRTR